MREGSKFDVVPELRTAVVHPKYGSGIVTWRGISSGRYGVQYACGVRGSYSLDNFTGPEIKAEGLEN